MNPNLPIMSGNGQEHFLALMQMFQASQAQHWTSHSSSSNPNPPLQPNNAMPVPQPFHPGLISLQMQAMMQTIVQMQAQQQQTQLDVANLLQAAGAAPQFQFPANIGNFRTSQNTTPSVPSNSRQNPAPANAFSSADDDILARTVHEDDADNLEETLGSLNGVGGHTTAQWITYYIRNTKKISQRIKRLENAQPKPSTSAALAPTFPSHSKQPLTNTPRQAREIIERAQQRDSSYSSRETHRSQQPPPRTGEASHGSISLSPPPPMKVVSMPDGRHRYTEEDRKYFKNFLAHTLRYNSDALDTPMALSEELEERAPHHTAVSWCSYMHKHQDVVESIRRRVLGGDHSGFSDSESGDSDHDSDIQEQDDGGSKCDEREVSLSSSESEGELRTQDIRFTDSAGGRACYPPGERRALAKHIASITLAQWDNTQENWSSFQKKYNKHSIPAWKEWYRRNKEGECDVERTARRFEIRNAKRKQAGRSTGGSTNYPTPSSSHSREELFLFRPGPSAAGKRAREDDDFGSCEPQLAKRSRPFRETPLVGNALIKSESLSDPANDQLESSIDQA